MQKSTEFCMQLVKVASSHMIHLNRIYVQITVDQSTGGIITKPTQTQLPQ